MSKLKAKKLGVCCEQGASRKGKLMDVLSLICQGSLFYIEN